MNPLHALAPDLKIGILETGAHDRITDVPGVTVGHYTLADGRHNTGITVIVPAEGNLFADKLTAASYVINGFGKTAGTVQVNELGTLETPIALTSTLQVGRMCDALVGYTLDQCARDGVECFSVNPLVGETNSSMLSDDRDRPLGPDELAEAFRNAAADFAEGDVGAGKGTVCFGLKGGIGTASRVLRIGTDTYTVGVLVQTNFGILEDLQICGRPVGRRVRALADRSEADQAEAAVPKSESDQGSVMIVVATDLPVDALSLRRIISRAEVGLVRTGSYVGHGSGDIVLGFTTANRHRAADGLFREARVLNEGRIEEAFRAVAECTEESIYRSLLAARRVTGYNGAVSCALSEFLPAAWTGDPL